MNTWWLIALAVLATIGFVVGLVRADRHRRAFGRKARGIDPGDGDQLVAPGESFVGPGNEDATGRVTRVTRDPQAYAKGFVPSNRRQK